MKRFFAKATKPFAINTDIANDPGAKKLSSKKGHESKPSFDASNIPPISKGLKPKYLLPAVPHPCPHDHLAIAAVDEGLLIRPFSPGQSPQNALKGPTSYVKVSWKTGEVTELHYSNEKKPADHPSNAGPIPLIERVNWEEAVVVYGIVGMLELFSCEFRPYPSTKKLAHDLCKAHISLSSLLEAKWAIVRLSNQGQGACADV